ncbi:GNAT family N-acetyltransferase [Granulosicoccus sp. 3-233]|uniref:GNAT family N-acetyltransferase n=1 Tax=Granulosicoccus sp. 3-233 TaxID=3417969 RepID=UPI003D347CCC
MNQYGKPSTEKANADEGQNGLPPLPLVCSLDRDVVTDDAAFRDLAVDWNHLLGRSPGGSVFMRWEWHYTWWQVYAGRHDHLHIITWRRNGELVGLLPLYRQACGIVPGRTCLRLTGTGELAIDEVATEYGDLLVDSGLQAEVCSLASEYLLQFNGWIHIEMPCLLEGSLLHQVLVAGGRSHLRVRSAGLRYRLPLLEDEAGYLDSLGASRAKRIRRSQKAAARDGGIAVTTITSAACFDTAFRELAELNHERQAHKRRKSVFASARFQAFHRQLSRQLFAEGAVDIVRFHLGARLLAVLYCYYDEVTCHYYQSGFTRKDSNRYMPLTLAHLMEMQRNREADRKYYDFMRGEAPTYKEEFNCETSAMVNVSVYRWRWQLSLAIANRRLRAGVGKCLRALGSG